MQLPVFCMQNFNLALINLVLTDYKISLEDYCVELE